ncbi:MAG: SpoIID/LytB domain-containing protein [Candidatus Krumholzibacteriia bacterium]
MPKLLPDDPRRRRLRAAARVLIVGGLLLLLGGCMAPKRITTVPRPPGPAPLAGPGGPVLVRIGMVEDAPRIVITADGPWRLGCGDQTLPAANLPADRTVALVRAGDGVAAADSALGIASAWLVAAPLDSSHVLTWDGKAWRGELHVIPTPGGTGLTLIDVLELERYLAGVVPREIGNGRERADLAAVAAQAVAARTYTVAHLDAQRDRGFDLYADVRDQAYGESSGRTRSATRPWSGRPASSCAAAPTSRRPTTIPRAAAIRPPSRRSGRTRPIRCSAASPTAVPTGVRGVRRAATPPGARCGPGPNWRPSSTAPCPSTWPMPARASRCGGGATSSDRPETARWPRRRASWSI